MIAFFHSAIRNLSRGCSTLQTEFFSRSDGGVPASAGPQQKFSYSWRYEGYEGDSLVTMELFPEGNKTRFKLTHVGLDTFPPIPDFGRENFTAGWTMIVGQLLRDYVELSAGNASSTAD